MNIFATYSCPIKSAKYLDNKRRNKMILETFQILSTAARYYGYSGPSYKPTHVNHPSNVWARQNKNNFLWLLVHVKELSRLYTLKTGKTHKSFELYSSMILASNLLPDQKMTPFKNCAKNTLKGADFSSLNDVHKAYRLYLRNRWKNDKIKPTWY